MDKSRLFAALAASVIVLALWFGLTSPEPGTTFRGLPLRYVNVPVETLREGPGVNHQPGKQLLRGAQVRVVQEESGWSEVVVARNTRITGWLPSRVLSDATPLATLRTEMIDVPTANVRAGPGTDHPIVGQLTELAVVEIVSEKSGWEQIRTPGLQVEGWILGKLTSAQPRKAQEATRKLVAEKLEEMLLDSYRNATVRAVGRGKRTLRIYEPIVTRVTAHHLQKRLPWEEIQRAGFRKVELYDDRQTFTWDLE